MAKRRKLKLFTISAVTGEGIEPLKYAIAELVATHRPEPQTPTRSPHQTKARLPTPSQLRPRPRPLAQSP